MNCWIIAVACSIINFLILGIARLAPLLFVASVERYNVNRRTAAFPYVLCYVLRCFSGPLVGFVGRKYNLRTVTLFGCFLSFIGTGACYFAEDVIGISVFWGVTYGLGFCFASALLPIVLDRTFGENHKTKANGIALAGASLGAIAIPPIVEAAIAEYGLSGSFLIVSGLMLHCVPASLLLPVSNLKSIVSKNQEPKLNATLNANTNVDQDGHTEKCCNPSNTFYHEIVSTNESETTKVSHINSLLNKNSSLNGNDRESFKTSNENTLSGKDHENGISTSKIKPEEQSRTQNVNSEKNKSNASFKCLPKLTEPSRSPKLLQVSIRNENDQIHGKFSESKICKEGEKETTAKKEGEIHESLFRSLRMFLDPTFLLIMVTQSLCAFIIMVVWTITIDVVRDKDIDRSSEIYYVILPALADTIGRVSLGWITDGGYLSKTQFSVVSFSFLSLITILFVFVYSPVMVMLVMFSFGFVSGGLLVVFPGVVCEFMNPRYKLMAMSSRVILLAPLSFTISPLIGYFREHLGSYDGLFYVLFSISILCCGMAALIPRFSQRSKLKYESEKT